MEEGFPWNDGETVAGTCHPGAAIGEEGGLQRVEDN